MNEPVALLLSRAWTLLSMVMARGEDILPAWLESHPKNSTWAKRRTCPVLFLSWCWVATCTSRSPRSICATRSPLTPTSQASAPTPRARRATATSEWTRSWTSQGTWCTTMAASTSETWGWRGPNQAPPRRESTWQTRYERLAGSTGLRVNRTNNMTPLRVVPIPNPTLLPHSNGFWTRQPWPYTLINVWELGIIHCPCTKSGSVVLILDCFHVSMRRPTTANLFAKHFGKNECFA